MRKILLVAMLVVVGGVGGAQDRRVVVEPKIPVACAVVVAELRPVRGELTEAEERGHRDNLRIESAMEKCAAGKAVVLRAGRGGKDVFLIGPMRLRAGVTLVIEGDVAVWGSRDAREYDLAAGSCGVLAEKTSGCKPLILAEDAPHSGIMGDGVIDGRGGAKLLAPVGSTLPTETWWELAHRAKVEDRSQTVSRILVVRRSDDFTLYRVTLRNSPNCHASVEATRGFTAWGVKVDTPKWARNTDGIDPQAGTSDVTIAESWIRAGDDNISPKSNAAGAVSYMTVRDTHFYNGHGMSIGSQTSGGISHVLVKDLVIDGSDNGLRIKSDRSRGGLVEDVKFERVCIRNSLRPIVIDPFYTTFGGEKIPVYKGIVLKDVHSLTPGTVTVRGLEGYPVQASFENVRVDGQKAEDVVSGHARLELKGVNFEIAGADVESHASAVSSAPFDCAGKFVSFPENVKAPVAAIVVPPEDKTFYVAADGTGDYYSVAAAIKKVPMEGGLVMVGPGVYRERVWIEQSHVTLRSSRADARETVIVFDTSAGTRGNLPGIATVQVKGDDFTAENITFENDFNRTHEQVSQGSQAQALNLGGDRNVLRNVRILGNQDTLYIGAKGCGQSSGPNCVTTRSYFEKCFVSGNVDFIYGDGVALFEGCEIHNTVHAAGGYLTAQGKHYAGQDSVFVFDRCKLTAEPGVKNVFLGRPWRPLASVVFLRTEIGAHIAAEGWHEWHAGETHYLDTAFYVEYGSTGAGAGLAEGVRKGRQLSAGEAEEFSAKKLFKGWEPEGR